MPRCNPAERCRRARSRQCRCVLNGKPVARFRISPTLGRYGGYFRSASGTQDKPDEVNTDPRLLAPSARDSGAPASAVPTPPAARGRAWRTCASRASRACSPCRPGNDVSGPDAPYRQRVKASEHDTLAEPRALREQVHLREPLKQHLENDPDARAGWRDSGGRRVRTTGGSSDRDRHRAGNPTTPESRDTTAPPLRCDDPDFDVSGPSSCLSSISPVAGPPSSKQ